MVAVPRKAAQTLAPSNVRGVMASSHQGKAFARACRSEAAACLRPLSENMQHGVAPGGGAEYPAHVCKLATKLARQKRQSVALLFVDLRGAFYAIMQEAVVGSAKPHALRANVLRG